LPLFVVNLLWCRPLAYAQDFLIAVVRSRRHVILPLTPPFSSTVPRRFRSPLFQYMTLFPSPMISLSHSAPSQSFPSAPLDLAFTYIITGLTLRRPFPFFCNSPTGGSADSYFLCPPNSCPALNSFPFPTVSAEFQLRAYAARSVWPTFFVQVFPFIPPRLVSSFAVRVWWANPVLDRLSTIGVLPGRATSFLDCHLPDVPSTPPLTPHPHCFCGPTR